MGGQSVGADGGLPNWQDVAGLELLPTVVHELRAAVRDKVPTGASLARDAPTLVGLVKARPPGWSNATAGTAILEVIRAIAGTAFESSRSVEQTRARALILAGFGGTGTDGTLYNQSSLHARLESAVLHLGLTRDNRTVRRDWSSAVTVLAPALLKEIERRDLAGAWLVNGAPAPHSGQLQPFFMRRLVVTHHFLGAVGLETVTQRWFTTTERVSTYRTHAFYNGHPADARIEFVPLLNCDVQEGSAAALPLGRARCILEFASAYGAGTRGYFSSKTVYNATAPMEPFVHTQVSSHGVRRLTVQCQFDRAFMPDTCWPIASLLDPTGHLDSPTSPDVLLRPNKFGYVEVDFPAVNDPEAICYPGWYYGLAWKWPV